MPQPAQLYIGGQSRGCGTATPVKKGRELPQKEALALGTLHMVRRSSGGCVHAGPVQDISEVCISSGPQHLAHGKAKPRLCTCRSGAGH
eukprot:1159483-Pelagomonas_calceolata.AAC.19